MSTLGAGGVFGLMATLGDCRVVCGRITVDCGTLPGATGGGAEGGRPPMIARRLAMARSCSVVLLIDLSALTADVRARRQ